MKPISKHTAEHYAWGDGCDGWHLMKSDSLAVIQETVPPGTSETAHHHQHSRQFFFVLEGGLSIWSPEGVTRLCAGEGVQVEPGMVHRVWNPTEAPVHFLVISSPPSHGDRVLASIAK
ncbi:MAG: cupin domain-containing protein [Verrucomicrobiota bacterium]